MNRRTRSGALAALPLAFLLASPPALAGSDTHYQDSVVGVRAAGMGGAFTALGDEASGAFYNPAGIVVDRSTLIQASMSAYKLQQKKVGVLDVCGKQLEVDEGGFFGFPASFGFVKLLGGSPGGSSVRHAVGLTLTVPQSEKSSQGTVVEGADCGLLQIDEALARIDVDRTFTGGLSYAVRPLPWLSAGVTAGVAVRGFTQTYLSGTLLMDPVSGETSYPQISMENIDGTIWSLFLQLGVIVEPLPGLRAGLSLTTPYLQLAGGGRLDWSDSSLDQTEWQQTAIHVLDDVGYRWKVPMRLALGLAYRRPGRFSVAADVTLHPPVSRYPVIEPHARIDSAEIPTLERELVVNFNVGAEVYLGRLALRGGLFSNFSSHPALDANDPDAAFDDDIDYLGASLGVSFATDEHSSLGLVVQGQYGSGEALKLRLAATGDPLDPLSGGYQLADVSVYALIISIGGNVDLD